MSIFEGSAVAIVTPFTEDGADLDRLKKLLDFQIEGGTDAIVICGTTGEPATMTADEKKAVIKTAVDHVAGRVPVIAGAGSNCTKTAIEWSLFAEEAGADALLHVTPFYNKCSQEGLYRHYTAIADAVSIPIVIYNVPSRTGVNVQPATLARLAKHKNIAAMKEASGNISQIAEMVRLCGGDIDFYSGNDDQTVPIMALGGKGVISVTANVAPDKVHAMTAAYLRGDTALAAKMQLCQNPLNSAMFTDVNPIPVKTALKLMGLDSGIMRLPLCPMSDEKEKALADVLKSYGLI